MNNCCRCFPDDQEFHLCPPCEQILQNRITVVLDKEFPQDQGYDSDWLAEPLPKYFECALCFGAFREPVQIRECGHVFCTGCLDHATREKRLCPNHRDVPFTQTFPDQAKRRDVLSLNVACKNEGCAWQGELSDLLEHLRRRCLKIRFACLNEGCEEVLCRENLFAHINDECQFRLIACEFCALSITFCQIKKHHSVDCQRIPTSCDFVCGKRFPRNEIPEHSLVCERRPLKCVFADFGCTFLGEISDMTFHVENSVSDHLKRTTDKLRDLQTKHDDLTTKHDDLTTKHDDLNAKHEAVLEKFENLTSKQDKMQNQIHQLQVLLVESDFKNKNTFYWPISEYQKNFQNAQNKNPEAIYSPVFYPSHGYEFQLCVDLNGCGSGENTHTSVYFCLCKGVNDDTLEWPFNKKYTLTIVSQYDTVADKTYTFVPAEQGEVAKKCFKKPTTHRNLGRGNYLFLPHTEKEQYIKDDTMLIKCVVR